MGVKLQHPNSRIGVPFLQKPDDMLKFSVITCTWNSAETLGDTINSVQSQKYPNIEHIFVDGGSTDATLDMITYMCPTARVLRNVTGGISRAMNAGIEAATGDVIAHLHSDDYYVAPDVLSMVSGALSGGAQWAYGKISLLHDSTPFVPPYPFRSFTYALYAGGWVSVPHPATFVRRTVFEELGYFNKS